MLGFSTVVSTYVVSSKVDEASSIVGAFLNEIRSDCIVCLLRLVFHSSGRRACGRYSVKAESVFLSFTFFTLLSALRLEAVLIPI